MKVAAIQMVSGTRLEHNLRIARELLAEAAAAGAELAVLPEYFCLMGRHDGDKLAFAELLADATPGAAPAGTLQRWLSDAARELGIWLVGGTLPLALDGAPPASAEAPAERCRNASLAYAPDGRRVAHYDKIHLFRFDDGTREYDESKVLVAGSTPSSFELPSRDGHRWRLGLSVCYDLRFPELYRDYSQAGCDLLLVPSAFTHVTGQAHWQVLLRARAIENLACVVAAAQGGVHENDRQTWGHSLVADAWGRVLAEREAEGAGVVLAELNAADMAQRRRQLPALSHRVLK